MSIGPRIAIVSNAASGGAGIAAYRLARALNEHTSARTDLLDEKALGRLSADVAPEGSFSNGRVSDVRFSVEYPAPARRSLLKRLSSYDVINVHWSNGLISLSEIHRLASAGRRIIITMHDYNHLTGGCHYPASCPRLATGCHGCPQINGTRAPAELPGAVARARREILSFSNVRVVAPSIHLTRQAMSAGLVPAERLFVVRNPFAPRTVPRERRGAGPFRVLLIADRLSDRRKNTRLAGRALTLAAQVTTLSVDLVGDDAGPLYNDLRAHGLAVTAHRRLSGAPLETVLREADIIFSPSLEDNWPNVLVEAGVYGAVPVVGPGHGCQEFVTTFTHGCVAANYWAEAFANALLQAVADYDWKAVVAARRRIAAVHAPAAVAARALTVFCEKFERRAAVG